MTLTISQWNSIYSPLIWIWEFKSGSVVVALILKIENESSIPVASTGCNVIDRTGVTLTVTTFDIRGAFGAFPVDLAVPAVTGVDD